MSDPSREWSSARIAELTEYWSQGLTTREIGLLMGVTKSAIIGKAHRLGLPARPSPISKTGEKKPPAEVKRRALPAVVEAVAPEPATKFLPPRSEACAWIDGDGPPWRFCGEPTTGRSSYCGVHHARAWRKAA